MSKRPLRIAMVISSLSAGGAERVLVLVARGLKALGHRVSIVTVFGGESDFYALPEGVDRIALDMGKTTRTALEKITANRKRISSLRQALRRIDPDVVISFLTEPNVLAVLAGSRLNVPVIVTEHADPIKAGSGWIWRQMAPLAYRRASPLARGSAAAHPSLAWPPQA